jgi:hypothetical protein
MGGSERTLLHQHSVSFIIALSTFQHVQALYALMLHPREVDERDSLYMEIKYKVILICAGRKAC